MEKILGIIQLNAAKERRTFLNNEMEIRFLSVDEELELEELNEKIQEFEDKN